MTYQAHTQARADQTAKTSWKYKLGYGIVAWIIAANLPDGLGLITFIGLLGLYPIVMSYITVNKIDFFKNERTYLWEELKLLPVWGKAMGFAAVFSLLPGSVSVGVHPISDFISLTFVFCLIGYPIAYGYRQIKKSAAQAKDQL